MTDVRSDCDGMAASLTGLAETQAAFASFLYVDLVNLGVLEKESAAQRLRVLASILSRGSDAHVARTLAERLNAHANSLLASNSRAPRCGNPSLRVVQGGRGDL
jgi:hypothetical protein